MRETCSKNFSIKKDISEAYKNKSKKLSFKFFSISVLLFFVTFFHFTLNLFSKTVKNYKNLFFVKKNELVLNNLIEKMAGISIVKQEIFRKKSFFERTDKKNLIHFNKLIKRPFLGICFSEKSFYIKYGYFNYQVFKLFLMDSKFKKVILYDEYSLPSLMLLLAANSINLKTFGIQHGIIPYDHKGYEFYSKLPNIFHPDKLFVNSNSVKNRLIDKGFPSKKLFVSGDIKTDNILNNFEKKKRNKNKKIITWFTQTHDPIFKRKNENAINCEMIFNFFDSHKDKYKLLIKLHPNEKQKNTIYHKFNKKYNGLAKIINGNRNSEDIVKISDAIMIKNSTVGMESVILDTPILILDLVTSRDYSIYVDSEFNLIVKNKTDLEKNLEKIFTEKYIFKFKNLRKKFIKQYYINIGKVSSIIMNKIKNEK